MIILTIIVSLTVKPEIHKLLDHILEGRGHPSTACEQHLGRCVSRRVPVCISEGRCGEAAMGHLVKINGNHTI